MSDAWRMRDFAQLAVSALGVRRLRTRSPEIAAALLEVELLLLAAWDVREALAAAGEGGGGVPAKPLLDPGLRRVRDALWPADAAVAVRDSSLDARSAASAVNLLMETLFVLTAWAPPRAVEVAVASVDSELRLDLRYRAQGAGEPDFARLRGDVESLGGRLEAAAATAGFSVTVTL